jgi:hypothetical protein
VKYRFTQGQPEPDAWYMCKAEGGDGVSLLEVQGKELKAEGVLEKPDNVILKTAPKSLTLSVQRGVSKGMYRDTISNEVTCPVK